ncbi:hypothetical protein NUU61_007435 [Penicillium alfredii]|uniref:Uncharacterized protein n=1 Tax=Penicillium alfredii TaxID=1506179 RepID=A0A9W9K4J4_9EURO|nr:uncharacterized protein NUU61_007435 [Penicillium alfredii]KAJ5092565.1 hypothetical protein NUU61_007435 [Penicillium alfredii]
MSNYLWTYNPTSGMVFTVVTNMGPAIFNLDKTTISQMTVRGKEELKADKYEELVGGPYTGSNGRITITFRQLQEQYKHYGIPIRIFEAKLEWPWYQGSKNPDGVWLYPSVRAKLKDSLRRTLSAFDPSNWRMKEVKLDYKARPNSDDAYTGRMISGVFFERPLGGDWNKAQYRTLTGAEYTIPNKGRGKAITPASANPVYLDLYYGTWNRAR